MQIYYLSSTYSKEKKKRPQKAESILFVSCGRMFSYMGYPPPSPDWQTEYYPVGTILFKAVEFLRPIIEDYQNTPKKYFKLASGQIEAVFRKPEVSPKNWSRFLGFDSAETSSIFAFLFQNLLCPPPSVTHENVNAYLQSPIHEGLEEYLRPSNFILPETLEELSKYFAFFDQCIYREKLEREIGKEEYQKQHKEHCTTDNFVKTANGSMLGYSSSDEDFRMPLKKPSRQPILFTKTDPRIVTVGESETPTSSQRKYKIETLADLIAVSLQIIFEEKYRINVCRSCHNYLAVQKIDTFLCDTPSPKSENPNHSCKEYVHNRGRQLRDPNSTYFKLFTKINRRLDDNRGRGTSDEGKKAQEVFKRFQDEYDKILRKVKCGIKEPKEMKEFLAMWDKKSAPKRK